MVRGITRAHGIESISFVCNSMIYEVVKTLRKAEDFWFAIYHVLTQIRDCSATLEYSRFATHFENLPYIGLVLYAVPNLSLSSADYDDRHSVFLYTLSLRVFMSVC